MSELGVLLPYQEEWVLDESTVSVWEKSRRIGASYAEALKSARLAMRNRDAGGQSTYYLSYNKEMTQQFVKDSAYWAKTFNAAVSDTEEVVLRNPDGDITVYRIAKCLALVQELEATLPKEEADATKGGGVSADIAERLDKALGLVK